MHTLSKFSLARSGLAVALAVSVATIGFAFVKPAFAQSPALCTDNDLTMSITKDVSATTNGSVVHFKVIVANTGPGACDITGAAISFTAPAADGTPTGTNTSLGSGLSLPANGTPQCWTSQVGTCPGGTTEIVNGALAWTVAVNAGVNDATAQANQTGSNAPTAGCPSGGAFLHDTTTGHTVCSSKTVGVEIVDAKILITPDGTNEVGNKHTFTGHVDIDAGAGFVPAPDGTVISFAAASGPGTFDTPTCTTTGGTGSCTDGLTSAVTGVTVVNASSTPVVEGIPLNRITNGANGNSGPATKTWIDLQILIDQNSTNEVGVDHTFTVTVNKDTGNGSGFAPAQGLTVTPSISGAGSLNGGTCSAPTDASGQCTIIVHSTSPGTATVGASTSWTFQGATVNRELADDLSGDSEKATKTWVDANIGITPDGDNPVNAPHTFTVTVMKDPGTGPVSAGSEHVDFTLTDTLGAASALDAVNSTCDDVGPNTDVNGQCKIVFTSPTAGQTVGHATVTLDVGGVSLTRATGDGKSTDSADATKTWHSFTAHLTTTVHDASHNPITTIAAGNTVHDSATVAGTNGGDPVPTGNVTFTFYSGPGSNVCDAQAVSAGSVALDGTGVAHPSDPEGPLAVGSYAFKANYAGGQDPNYPDGAAGDCEPFTVTALTPTVDTTVHTDSPDAPISGTLVAPLSVHDSATVGGSGPVPSGTVDFTFYSGAGAGTCSADATHVAAGTGVALVAGVAHPSLSETNLGAGTYAFKAHYNGDGNYSAADGQCEPFTVTQLTPQVSTTVHSDSPDAPISGTLLAPFAAHDSATVSGSGGTPSGTVDFTFYSGAGAGECSANASHVASGTGIALDGSGVAHPSASQADLGAGTYAFKAHYNGSATYAAADGPCEPFTVTARGHIIVKKVTSNGDTTTQFTYVTTGTGYNGFQLVGGGQNDQTLDAGSYAVAETPVSGWNSDGGKCLSSNGDTEVPGSLSLQAGETIICTFTNTFVAQYCSPGYWKQSQHFDNWTGYSASNTFALIFGRTITIMWSASGKPASLTGPTLLQALQANGGGINQMARVAVDALLNAAKLNSGFTTAQVISTVQQAIDTKNYSLVDQFTTPENCPLN